MHDKRDRGSSSILEEGARRPDSLHVPCEAERDEADAKPASSPVGRSSGQKIGLKVR